FDLGSPAQRPLGGRRLVTVAAPPGAKRQQGAATLLVALVLMIAITVVTLSVARTQLVQQKIANNESWHLRLSLQAEAAMALAMDRLSEPFDTLIWEPDAQGDHLVTHWVPPGDNREVRTEVLFSRPRDAGEFISVQATAVRDDHSGLQAQVSQLVRPLSVLTPLAETVPPLVVNGCISATNSGFDIRPLNADRDEAGDAVWTKQDAGCALPPGTDTYGGRVLEKGFDDDLWPAIFSVDRESLAALVETQAAAGSEPIYRSVEPADLSGGRWMASLGSPTQHIVLHFPPAVGCPEFASGVRIYGIVFIDGECADPVASGVLEIYGSLIVNGSLNGGDGNLRLSHIHVADSQQSRLSYPVLRTVPVPGSWRDF
ncbi:MAG: hypothetical protein J5I92_14365, partial [Thiogranum sp.]|nr:hypothetical protein [Thiogranum sp.]